MAECAIETTYSRYRLEVYNKLTEQSGLVIAHQVVLEALGLSSCLHLTGATERIARPNLLCPQSDRQSSFPSDRPEYHFHGSADASD